MIVVPMFGGFSCCLIGFLHIKNGKYVTSDSSLSILNRIRKVHKIASKKLPV